jgi:copper chaperone
MEAAMRFKVEGMTCDHCVGTVKSAVQKAVPGATVDVDLATGLVSVSASGTAEPGRVKAAIEDAGYTVERQVA